MEVLAIIPARSGSKSVKDKNIREINGKPMLAYSIEHGLKSEKINRVIVSTDSEKYAEIAKEYGAEVPFLRPEEYARQNHDCPERRHNVRICFPNLVLGQDGCYAGEKGRQDCRYQPHLVTPSIVP